MTTPDAHHGRDPHSTPRSNWPTSLMGRTAMSLRSWQILQTEKLAEACISLGAEFLKPPLQAMHAQYSADRWPARALRIGVVTPGDWCRPLFDQISLLPVEWFSLTRSVKPQGACARYQLDAVVEPLGDTGMLVQTAERPELPAMWQDWTADPEVSFPAAFPSRLDVSRLEWSRIEDLDWPLAHDLLIAAAVMSRSVARTTFADVLNGRHFQPDALTHIRRGEIAPLTPQRNWFDTSLLSATRRLAKEPSRDLTPVRQAAARLCGAAATMTDWRVDEHTRINAALAAGRVLGNDPISLLQLAAAQIGCFRDEQGVRTLSQANEAIRRSNHLGALDQIAFLNAEAATGEKVPLTTGRLAAGMCIAFAGICPTRIKFAVDDFFEELLDSGLLLGREPDIALLRNVQHELCHDWHKRSAHADGTLGQIGIDPATEQIAGPVSEQATDQVGAPVIRKAPRRTRTKKAA